MRRDPAAILVTLLLVAAAGLWLSHRGQEAPPQPPREASEATWEWVRLPQAKTPWIGEPGLPSRPPARIVRAERGEIGLAPRPPEAGAPLDGLQPTLPLPGQPPELERLRQALELLGGGRALRIGAYALHTDVEDTPLLRRLDRLAADLEDHYRARYGLSVAGQAAEAVVLYRREEDYRRFEQIEERLARVGSAGHTRRGVVALYCGDRPAEEIAGTLVHELAHLLNRRGLGPALPPWLDEGIADDLAQSRVRVDGLLEPGTLGGTLRRGEGRIDLRGARASLVLLQRAIDAGTAPRVPDLLERSSDDFIGADKEQLYAASLFWVRFLLAGNGGALSRDFRAFLAAVAAGAPATPDALATRLRRPWPQLELEYRLWLRSLDALAGEEVPLNAS